MTGVEITTGLVNSGNSAGSILTRSVKVGSHMAFSQNDEKSDNFEILETNCLFTSSHTKTLSFTVSCVLTSFD